jgi:mRNA (guanine-N7-)-methyltransferase
MPLEEKVPEPLLTPLFDNVSLQFCMHYAWSDVPKVRILLENISKHLRKGGVFLGTIPDGDKLIAKLKGLPGDELKFGNSIYSVEFEQKDNLSLFGHKYKFFLADAVEDVPEFVVDWSQFES